MKSILFALALTSMNSSAQIRITSIRILLTRRTDPELGRDSDLERGGDAYVPGFSPFPRPISQLSFTALELNRPDVWSQAK